MAAQTDRGPPILQWRTRKGRLATPPADANEWKGIIAGISRILLVRLVSKPRGRWWISKAEENPPQIGAGPYRIAPIDRRDEVRKALQDAGKPVVD